MVPGVAADVRWSDGELHQYDYRTNTITVASAAEAGGGAPGPAEARMTHYRDEMLALLQSGDAYEEGAIDVDGREAIRIASAASNSSMLVDADTYEPIEWRTDGALSCLGSTGSLAAWSTTPTDVAIAARDCAIASAGGTTLSIRFEVYEQLPATPANLDLLSIEANHPDATTE